MSERARLTVRIAAALAAPDFPRSLEDLADIPPKKRLRPLFVALLAREGLVRWPAVTALGAAGADLAEADPEQGRDFWRNLMWRLNEESGTMGWGVPEVMGETLARSPVLAEACSRLLFAYVRDLPGPASAALDHPALRRGVWWGIARLAAIRPDVARPARELLPEALAAPDPATRGLACLVLSRLGPPAEALAGQLAALAADRAAFELYWEERLAMTTVAALAEKAVAAWGGAAAGPASGG